MEIIKLNLNERTYPIYIGANLTKIGETLSRFNLGKKILIISNAYILSLYGKTIERSLKDAGFSVFLTCVPEGEEGKSLPQAAKLYECCLKYKLDRSSTILSLGGGVIGDLSGFVAATYLRGINFINVPTTLLSQVDASIGGKVAVNLPAGKNLVGTFYQPKFVYIDPSVLKTLSFKEIKNGMAEIVKYGMIKDAEFFSYLEENLEKIKNLNEEALNLVITRSVEIKVKVVEEDEREERGKREILNFGHTFGHALEKATNYKGYTHGEAVAIGMVIASKIACKVGIFSQESLLRLKRLLQKIGLPVEIGEIDREKAFDALYLDKKRREGKLRFLLPERIGKVILTEKVPSSLIEEIF